MAKTLKSGTKNKDYFENQDYIITSLFGHILELYKMDDYNKEYKQWNIEDLPFFPEKFEWKLKNQKGIKERYNLIEKLILRDDVDTIINCGDNDREGEVLVNNIIYYIFKKKKIEKNVKRILLPDLAQATIKNELEHLRDIKKTENWYKEGLARTYVDWLYGINFSRFVSIKTSATFPVGRVIVPTVKFIYDREMEIENFKEKKYFQIEGVISKDNEEIKIEFAEKYEFEKEKQLEVKNTVEKIIEDLQKHNTKVTKIEEKESIKKPKKLFSLKTIQNYMFSKYKINLSKTLEYAQTLYEKTYTTYPRTNSEYLTEEEKNKIEQIIKKINEKENIGLVMKDSKRIFDSNKVESHSAIIITGNIPKTEEFTEDENKLYNAIKNRFCANFCNEDCIIKEQMIKIQVEDTDYKSCLKGTTIKQQGYLKFENDLNEKAIPKFEEGEILNIKFNIVEKKTNPPTRVTEAELNNFYENPFKKQEQEETTDEDYIAILKGAEIGTPATRAGIIEKVKQDGYITNSKNNLVITDKGIKLIEVLDQLEINLYKEKTVEIGQLLKNIFNNKNTIDDVLNKVKEEVRQGIKKEKEIEIFASTKETIGYCPICNGTLKENQKSYYCENWKECGFSIWKQFSGKKLSATLIKELLEKGYTKKLKGFKSKNGKNFDARLILEDNRVKFKFD